MSHEIKFKGKRVDNGEWVYGYFKINKPFIEDRYYIIVKNMAYQVEKESVAQYIGLKDMVGTEIYHKDIMGFAGFDYEERKQQTDYFVVEFGKTYDVRYGYYLATNSDQKVFHSEFAKGKVCGTVFENKDLIPHYRCEEV